MNLLFYWNGSTRRGDWWEYVLLKEVLLYCTREHLLLLQAWLPATADEAPHGIMCTDTWTWMHAWIRTCTCSRWGSTHGHTPAGTDTYAQSSRSHAMIHTRKLNGLLSIKCLLSSIFLRLHINTNTLRVSLETPPLSKTLNREVAQPPTCRNTCSALNVALWSLLSASLFREEEVWLTNWNWNSHLFVHNCLLWIVWVCCAVHQQKLTHKEVVALSWAFIL